MRRHADRSHAGSAAAVGDAESLVQVQVADVRADVARAAETDLGVHVGAVHVDLAAVLVDDPADLPDRALEDAVGRRVGDHQRGERVAVCGGLGPEVLQIDVAPGVALDRHDLHAGHHRARGVGAVGRLGNEAGGPMGVAPGAVIGPHHQQAGVFALGSRVGLQRDGGKAGDLRQLVLQLAEEELVAGRLVPRGEGMQPVELRAS